MPHQNDYFSLPQRESLSRPQLAAIMLAAVVFGILLTLFVIRVAYRGKLLPGASAYGVYLGGLSQTESNQLIKKLGKDYQASGAIIVRAKSQPEISLPKSQLALSYPSESAIQELYRTGRQGWIWDQLGEQFSLMLGLRESPKPTVRYDGTALYAALRTNFIALDQPVQNASLQLLDERVSVVAGTPGRRIDIYKLDAALGDTAGNFTNTPIEITTTDQLPSLNAADLSERSQIASVFADTPLSLSFGTKSWAVPSAELISWLNASTSQAPAKPDLLRSAYPLPSNKSTDSSNSQPISNYLAELAKSIDKPAIDARLTIEGGRASVFQRSQDGSQVDIVASTTNITAGLKSRSAEAVPLVVAVKKAAVTDDTIDELGIVDLLSEGVSYFPGSSSNRITNVRIGSAQYNGVLLKPGQIFSFGALLGEVGPAQGYKEGRIILEGRQESAYDGGLCQVSSTAFRAALLAGLPILERVNHSFAVSYYTAPFGVPGVDATIYYPEVDFKFKNDTNHHILIQTELIGTTLKFRFYGTKQKEGAIRGPSFVYGSNDPNQPSQTIFYRDISVGGKVIKTDTFRTSYKSALDFPPVQ